MLGHDLFAYIEVADKHMLIALGQGQVKGTKALISARREDVRPCSAPQLSLANPVWQGPHISFLISAVQNMIEVLG